MFSILVTWALAAAQVTAPAAAAPTSAAPATATAAAQAFGAREAVSQISLSPDGTHVAIIAPRGAGEVLTIGNIATGGDLRAIMSSSGDPDHLRRCDWTTATRLVCSVELSADNNGARRINYTRMIALDSDGGNVRVLVAQSNTALGFAQRGGEIIDLHPAEEGSVLIMREYVPEYRTGTILASTRSGIGVDRLDTRTLRRTVVEPPRMGAVAYLSDGNGQVRIMGIRSTDSAGYDRNVMTWMYRRAGSRDWLPLSRSQEGIGFNPVAVDRARNQVVGFERRNGRLALYRVTLDEGLARELVLERPDVDVDSVVQVGRQARVVGASFATDRRQTQFFDPELARLQSSLGRALPDAPLVTFVDASADERKLLLFIGGDRDPGRYYLYDKATRRLGEVVPARPELASYRLAPVRAITFPAADGTQIPGYLTLPPGSDGRNLPAIVMPHGGPGARDEWGFDWLSQFFAARGFAVLQPNFRGSTGYGEAWFQRNGFQSWRTAIGDVDDAGRYLQRSGIAAPGKLAIVGWSYGGYAALQSAVHEPGLFKAVVAVAPVTDLNMLREESRNFTSYAQVDAFIGHGDHIRAGSPLQNVRAITVPVLMFHGDRDVNVGVGESRAMADRLRGAGKPVTYVEYRRLDHYLLDATTRADLLGKADAFLRTSLGLGAP